MDWHNVLDPADPALDDLAVRYGLHPLHIEDCRHRNQSAKLEDSEGYLFTVLKSVRIDGEGEIETADLDIFLGSDFVITVLEEDCPELRASIDQLRDSTSHTDRPDQVYYRIVDRVVDSYIPILDKLEDRIDVLEDEALESPAPSTLAAAFEAKRSMVMLRRVLSNTRDVSGRLLRDETRFINRDLWPFFRDVYDHVTRNLDTVDILRDLLNGTLDVYLSSVSNRTNQVMKVLTVMGTVALPALVVSGVYGMNVHGLPGAESPYGIITALSLMVVSTAALLYLLRRFGWL